MNTNQKLAKRIIVGFFSAALMLNMGLSFQMDSNNHISSISLTSMGIQAQDEGGSDTPWYESAWDSVVDWFEGGGDPNNQETGAPSGIGYTETHEVYRDTIVQQPDGRYEVIRLYEGSNDAHTVTTGGGLDAILAWFRRGK